MKFGLRLTDTCIKLIDIKTGEILAEGSWDVKIWFAIYDGDYTLVLVD